MEGRVGGRGKGGNRYEKIMKGSNKGEREGSEVLGREREREREGRGGNRYKRIVKESGKGERC